MIFPNRKSYYLDFYASTECEDHPYRNVNMVPITCLNFPIAFLMFMSTDGQKIAKRLCSQITKETRTVQHILGEYNAILENPMDAISAVDALDPSKLKCQLQLLGIRATGSQLEERREIIQAFLCYKRSLEEIDLLKEDINNVVTYYEAVKSTVVCEIDLLEKRVDPISRGMKALLHHFLADLEQRLRESRISAKSIHTSRLLSPVILDDYSSDSDECDCD